MSTTWVVILCAIVFAATVALGLWHLNKPEWTETKQGTIVHPAFGEYPAHKEWSEGMTLMPGQSTTYTIGIVVDSKEDTPNE